jgi:hypothetical protein
VCVRLVKVCLPEVTELQKAKVVVLKDYSRLKKVYSSRVCLFFRDESSENVESRS